MLQGSQAGPHDGVPVTAVVKDVQGQPVPHVPVEITGGDGVLFSTAAGTPASPFTLAPQDDLRKVVSTSTTREGQLRPVYAYFTRTGLNLVTVKAGGRSATARVIAPASTDPYRVSVGDAEGHPGARLVVMGAVLDAFGNPVPDLAAGLTLAVGDTRLGALHSDAVATDTGGMFSTAIRASETRRGRTTLTAALIRSGLPLAADPRPAPAWLVLAGVQLPHGQRATTARVILSREMLFTATPALVGGGKARLRGTAEPGSLVDIFARPAHLTRSQHIGTVMANRDGNWGIGTTIRTTTSFRARSGDAATAVLTTHVHSAQTVRARPLGEGRIRFTVHGRPSVRGWVNIYENGVRVAHQRSNRRGDLTLTLQSEPGVRTFVVHFVAPGTTLKPRSVTGDIS